MGAILDGNVKSFTAAAAIAKGVLVKATTTAGRVDVAGLGDVSIGVAEEPCFAAEEPVSVRLRSAAGTLRCKASGAFAVGVVVYGRASGLIDDISTTSAVKVGTALEAATASGDLVEVLPHP